MEGVGRQHAGGEPEVPVASGLIGARKFGSSLQVRTWGGCEILGPLRGGLSVASSRLGQRSGSEKGYLDSESETDMSAMSDGIVILVWDMWRSGVSEGLSRAGVRGWSPLRSSWRRPAVWLVSCMYCRDLGAGDRRPSQRTWLGIPCKSDFTCGSRVRYRRKRRLFPVEGPKGLWAYRGRGAGTKVSTLVRAWFLYRAVL